MKNLIPHQIAQSLADNKRRGKLLSKSLFLDISGFTKMTEALMKNGKSGAEALSKMINSVFEPILQELYYAGGFITTFAGDAFTAIFPDNPERDVNQIRDCASKIMNIFANNPIHKTLWGEFILEAKIGLSGGAVEWGILEEGDCLGYFFKGDAIDGCANAEHQCEPGMIAMQQGLGYEIPSETKALNDSSSDYLLFRPRKVNNLKINNITLPEISADLVKKFLPLDKFPQGRLGEFRNIVSVFILFDEEKIELQDIFSSLTNKSKENGGFLNLLDFGDKGGVALVLFGAPNSLEQKEKRAFDFSLQLLATQPSLRIGVAVGPCFTGFVGSDLRATYTALGETVNLSARLAISGQPGEITIPLNHFKNQESAYNLKKLESRLFKGISQPIPVGLLQNKKKQKQDIYLTPGFGRNTEKEIFNRWILTTLNGNKTQPFVISGELGIGKSQTNSDTLTPLGDKITPILFQFDTVFQKSFEPLKKYFKELFNEIETTETEPLENIFQQKLDSLVDDATPDYIKNEIKRVVPPLFQLADLEVKDKNYLALDIQAKHDRTIEALAAYFSLIALKSPSVFIIDQAQAMDEESKSFFKLLLTHTTGLSLGLIYLVRGDNLADLDITITDNIKLKPFSREELKLSVEREYQAKPEPELLDFLEKRTNGIPLYIFSLLTFLKKKEMISIDQGQVSLNEIARDALPKSLEDLLLSQIDSLPQELKASLPALAVLGNSFPKIMAQQMLGNESEKTIERLIENEIILEDAENNIHFQKDIIRLAVYQLQLNDHLKTLHNLAAESWVTQFPQQREFSQEKAYHFHKAEKIEEAKNYYLKSAEVAQENFFNGLALKQYRQFLALSDNENKNALVSLKIAQILEVTGKWDAAIKELKEGIGSATMSGDTHLSHKFFNLLGQIKFRQGETENAKNYFEKAVAEMEGKTIDADTVQTRIDLARVHILAGRSERAMFRLNEATAMATENNFPKEEGLALYYLGQVFSSRNLKDEAKRVYNRSLKIFRQLKKPRLIANPLYDLSLIAQNEGKLDLSRKRMQEAMDLYVQIGYKSGIAAALLNLGLMEDQVGEFEKGRDFFRRSKNIAEELGEHLGVGYAQFCQGASAFKGNELSQAINYLEEAHKIFTRLKVDSYLGYTLSYMASTLVRLGRGDEATSIALKQMRIIKSTGNDVEKGRTFLALAELLESEQKLSKQAEENLREICRLGKLDKATPGRFYRLALISAKEAHYVNSWIPSLFHFGEYLIKLGRERIGLKYIKKAHDESLASSWEYFAQSIEKKYPNIFS